MSTQGAKQRALAGKAVAPLDNLRFVALDLSVEPLPATLFNDGKATLFIIEGVLMYLSPVAMAQLTPSSPHFLRAVWSHLIRVDLARADANDTGHVGELSFRH